MKRQSHKITTRLLAATAAIAWLVSSSFAGAQGPSAQQQPPSPVEADRPNILFIIADDLNAGIAPFGGEAITPNLDRLASQGVSFSQAYAQNPWCGPSRASFLTGLRPDTVGVMDLNTPLRSRVPDIVTLPQYFRQHGYFTGRVGKIFHQGVPRDIGRDGADDPKAWDVAINPAGCDVADQDKLTNLTPGMPLGTAFTYLRHDCGDLDQTDGMVATQAIELLRQHSGKDDKPFFIAAGFYRPHVPEVVPAAYFDLYSDQDIVLASERPGGLALALPAARTWTNTDNFGMSDDQQRAFIRSYLAATSFLDAQVGRILDEVDALGLADDTIVVFTSDHGFLLGQHGQWEKQLLFEESAQVPLIFRVPGSKAGTRSSRTVELLDLYPTLLDLSGLPHNPRNDGQSLRRLIDRPDDPTWTKPALTQVAGGRSVRTQHYRYTEWASGSQGRELYDHSVDPREMHNLADDPRYAGAVELLRAMLPPGPVEQAPEKSTYDPERDCIVPSNRYTSEGRGPPPSIPGMKICDAP